MDARLEVVFEPTNKLLGVSNIRRFRFETELGLVYLLIVVSQGLSHLG